MSACLQSINTRMMLGYKRQQYYFDIGTPTDQFIYILEKWKRNLSMHIKSAMDMVFTIQISLQISSSHVVRQRFQLPGSTNLPVLHDQVLIVVMGWARAYHRRAFEDPTDGSCFGPKTYIGGIDDMHIQMQYFALADDRKLPLALPLQKPGDR